jgi:hypothetical protein
MSSTCRSTICVANSTRPAADLLQKRPDIALVEVDAEPLGDDALEVDAPPTHDAVFLALGPASTICANGPSAPPIGRGFEPSIQLSRSPSGPEALKR